MSSRLKAALDACNARNEKAMGLFITSGFPDPASTVPILNALVDGGADFLELGMPFSDPLAEGLPIQASSERALSHGVKMADTIAAVAEFRKTRDTPVLLMGYINPVLRYGIDAFCRDARDAGVDGLIIPDLPAGESGLIREALEKSGLDLVLLVAPTTDASRIRKADEIATGFIYAVSVAGLTGSELDNKNAIADYLRAVKKEIRQNHLMVGFGIRDHETAHRLAEEADGFIVGSALMREVEQLWDHSGLSLEDRLEQVRGFASTLKYGRPDQPA